MANNYVYFIRDTRNGLIKIGQSYDPSQRKVALGNSRHLEILATIPDHSLERELHAKFTKMRVHGEWFDPAPELLAYIEANKGRPDLTTQYRVVVESTIDFGQGFEKRLKRYHAILARLLQIVAIIDIKATAAWRRLLLRVGGLDLFYSRYKRVRHKTVIHRNGHGVEIVAAIPEILERNG